MPVTITPKNYILGTANVYYRAVGVNTPWSDLGVTLDDSTLRITAEWFRPDNLTGVKGPVMGLDVLRNVNAEFEFTIGDITGGQLTTLIPGSRVTAEVHADQGTTPFTSTLSANVAAGATTIAVVAATNLSVGDYIRIGTAPEFIEYRQVTAIQSLNISFRDALIYAHASGAAAVETTGDYRTMYQASLNSRMPDSAYLEWALAVPNGAGYHELRLPRGIATADTIEVSASNSALAGAHFLVQGRYSGADLTISPFNLYAPAN